MEASTYSFTYFGAYLQAKHAIKPCFAYFAASTGAYQPFLAFVLPCKSDPTHLPDA